jgi:hypothetical protein
MVTRATYSVLDLNPAANVVLIGEGPGNPINGATPGPIGAVLCSNGPDVDPSFQPLASINGPLAGFSGLTGSCLYGGSLTATWTASELIAENAIGGVAYKGGNLSFTFNGATTGVNGMDTGSFPSSGNDLYVYAIFNPVLGLWGTLGTAIGAGSLVYGGIYLPEGYTASVLIWAGKSAGSSILPFIQRNRRISVQLNTVVIAGSALGYSPINIASMVPVNAITCSGDADTGNANLTYWGANYVFIASTQNGLGETEISYSIGGDTGIIAPFTDMLIMIPQTIYYYVLEPGVGQMYIAVGGYTI